MRQEPGVPARFAVLRATLGTGLLPPHNRGMKIAVAQIACRVGDVRANVGRMVESIGHARAAGCELVVFPEMADTGYWPEKFHECAEPWPGQSFDALAAAAAEHSLAVVAGLAERQAEAIYNSVAFFGPSGELLGKYRKMHLYSPPPASEAVYCAAGNEVSLVNFGGLRWGLTICYDLRFPELYRMLAVGGAQVLVNVAAWPTARPTHWDYLTRARAIENQAFMIAANRTGQDGPFAMLGHSRVVAPMGELLAEAGREEELIAAELDLGLVTAFRTKIPVLADRRPALYRRLAEE